jgi:hypothetical protein
MNAEHAAPFQGSINKALSVTEEMMQFGQGNLEAVLKSNQILAKGIQEFVNGQAEIGRVMMEAAMGAFTSFGKIKSAKDVIDIQAGLLRTATQRAMESQSQISAKSLQLVEKAYEPIKARVELVADKLTLAA